MSEGNNILSLTFEFKVQELTTTDLAGNPITEELYTISCGDSVCWSLVSDKSGGEQEREPTRLRIEHILNHLQERLEHRAKRLGDESEFIAAKQMSLTGAKTKGQKFFRERVRSDEDRARRLLSIRRGQPRRLTKAQQAKLPERYDALHTKFKEIKKRHNEERNRVERERKRGLGHEEWRRMWREIARSLYPKEKREYLELLSDRDKHTAAPSNVALKALARETGYEPAYLGRLLTAARKIAKAKKSDNIPAE
jgi:hypothetical protein